MGNLGLANIVEVKKFQTDDEDRIRGCYNSHIEIYKEIASRYKGASDYSVLVLEDNISQSPLLSQSTLSNLASFQSRRQGGWDMLHLAYIMYVPGLQVTKTDMGGVVSLKTGEQAALGTTAYVISKRGVDALLEYHEKFGYTIAIPDLMARLFPSSRYAAHPMMFHRASKIKSLVNPQLDTLRELLFEPLFYTNWERAMVSTGLGTNAIFISVVLALVAVSARSGITTADAIKQLLTTGGYEGNVVINEEVNKKIADAFLKKIEAAEKAAKLRLLDNDNTPMMSMKLMAAVWTNKMIIEVFKRKVLWVTMGAFVFGALSKSGSFGERLESATHKEWLQIIDISSTRFLTVFILVWYLNRLWGRREGARGNLNGVKGCIQDITMLARASEMEFGHRVQLWRYMSCAIITAVNAMCGKKYQELEFAENMMNLHHLMTPQEAEVLEVWRPNTNYAFMEFIQQSLNVLQAAKKLDQISDMENHQLREKVLTLRANLGSLGIHQVSQPPYGVRQMVGFIVMIYNMFYAIARGVATMEIYKLIGSDITEQNSTDNNPLLLVLGILNFLVVTSSFFGLLQMCDSLRDLYGDGIMTLDVMNAVNFVVKRSKQICFFGEVYQYDTEAKRLVEDDICQEILENMYKRGFLDRSENETKWNLNDKKQRWRMYATRCLRKIFDKDGIKGIETLFKTADLDGSGELAQEKFAPFSQSWTLSSHRTI
ncbi:hypothetical protein TrRE_jg3493 [Triparma retinervis]|uniref:Uncharacterized protein n=1 Tax=Triparma retinervis TaxID=2557542 RepID=A0A9W7CFU6_9STRA|nr:hypothetical protein TrRE_jg3493 [Triparma retinervis]